jgi:hypothetical protein
VESLLGLEDKPKPKDPKYQNEALEAFRKVLGTDCRDLFEYRLAEMELDELESGR